MTRRHGRFRDIRLAGVEEPTDALEEIILEELEPLYSQVTGGIEQF